MTDAEHDELVHLARETLDTCRGRALKLCTAESCTGGLVAAYLTGIAGSSEVFERGFVTYSNEAKSELLAVPVQLILRHGAVSEEVALAMAEGALANSRADVSVAVTGIAGPGGGSADKPVGLVYVAAARRGKPVAVERHVFSGDRSKVRSQAVRVAFRMTMDAASA